MRRTSWVGVTVAAFVFALIALTSSPTSAATYVVAASGGDFTAIHPALNVAAAQFKNTLD